MNGPADLYEWELRHFAEDEIGLYVTLTRFGFEVEDGDRAEMTPAYWIAPVA